MVAKTDHLGAGAFIKSEGNGDISRDTLVIVSGSGKLLAGTVLGKITATGKYKPYDNDAVDGSQTAAAILVYDVDATLADATAVGIVRLAEVWTSRLVWATSVLLAEKAPAYVELSAANVFVR
jgi:hypothetical protein